MNIYIYINVYIYIYKNVYIYIYQSLIAKNGYMFLCKHKIQQMNIYIYTLTSNGSTLSSPVVASEPLHI